MKLKKLHDYLLGAGLTQKEFARMCGVNVVNLNKWIHGVRRVPERHCVSIEKASNRSVMCEDLRDDIDWGFLRGRNKGRRSTRTVASGSANGERKVNDSLIFTGACHD